jgi:hypothetical protein
LIKNNIDIEAKVDKMENKHTKKIIKHNGDISHLFPQKQSSKKEKMETKIISPITSKKLKESDNELYENKGHDYESYNIINTNIDLEISEIKAEKKLNIKEPIRKQNNIEAVIREDTNSKAEITESGREPSVQEDQEDEENEEEEESYSESEELKDNNINNDMDNNEEESKEENNKENKKNEKEDSHSEHSVNNTNNNNNRYSEV